MDTFFMFGFLITLLSTVYLYFERKNAVDRLKKGEKENARKLFELNILTELSDKIGYSLSARDIAHTIALTSEKLFEVTAVSYGIVEQDHIELITIAHDRVSNEYISGVKDIILQGMYTVDADLKQKPVVHKSMDLAKTENTSPGTDITATVDAKPQSYFNIPLVLNNRFTGIINITSKNPHAFHEEDMSMLYKIVNRASLAIGKLENVIATEKSKVDALVKSLSSGEIFFTIRYDSLSLFTINPAALRYLGIKEESPDMIRILSQFKVKPNFIGEMKEVIVMKKCTVYRYVSIGGLRFNIYIAPVFSLESDTILGVAITMQDVTREIETQKLREGFTNMMVHELRAPLTAIKGAAELLMKHETQEEDRVKMRLVIKNASERLLTDIDDMLDSAKIDAGKLTIEKTGSDINETVAKAVEELSYAASGRAILIENHPGSNIPVFAFDSARIGQVIVNLLSNAIKHSQPHTKIEVFTRLKDGKVEIEVKDNGYGIEKEKIAVLFKPFSQAHQLQKTHGTGLGLYISKAIVEGHEGKIWIESEVGKGTSVFFTLPVQIEEHAETPKASMTN